MLKNQYLSENDFKPKIKRIKNIPMKWGMIGRLGDFENYLEDKPDLVEIHLTWRVN